MMTIPKQRNPLLGLPAMSQILALPPASRMAHAALLDDLARQANELAEKSWKKRKGPMAAYWRAASTYAKHSARAMRHGLTPIRPT